MSRRRSIKACRRTFAIDGLGDVTVQGLPVDEIGRRYPELVGERPVAELGDEGYLHPAVTRQIAGQVVDPPMSIGAVEALSAPVRRALMQAMWEAHPETNALWNGEG